MALIGVAELNLPLFQIFTEVVIERGRSPSKLNLQKKVDMVYSRPILLLQVIR